MPDSERTEVTPLPGATPQPAGVTAAPSGPASGFGQPPSTVPRPTLPRPALPRTSLPRTSLPRTSLPQPNQEQRPPPRASEAASAPPSSPPPVPPPPPPMFDGAPSSSNSFHEVEATARLQRPRELLALGDETLPHGHGLLPHTRQALAAQQSPLPFAPAPPGTLVDEADTADVVDEAPPLPADHPSHGQRHEQRHGQQRAHASRPDVREAFPRSDNDENTATFVGLAAEPLPFDDEDTDAEQADGARPKRALLQLSSAPPALKPTAAPIVERTLRSPRKPHDAERTESAIDLPGDQLPFKAPAPGTQVVPPAQTAAIDIGAIRKRAMPMPLPFSADAGDTPDGVHALDAARRQPIDTAFPGTAERAGKPNASPHTAAMPTTNPFADSPETQYHDSYLQVLADPLPFRDHDGETGWAVARPTPEQLLPFQPSAPQTGSMPAHRQTLVGSDGTGDDALPFGQKVAQEIARHGHAPAVSSAQTPPLQAAVPQAAVPQTPETQPPLPPQHPQAPPAVRPPALAPPALAPPAVAPPAVAPPAVAPPPRAGELGQGVALHPVPPNPLRPDQPAPSPTGPTSSGTDSMVASLKPLLSVEDYARVKVAIWDRQLSLKQALAEYDIDEMLWRSNEERHAARIAEEAERGEAAFAQLVRTTVQQLRAAPASSDADEVMPLEEYAALRVAVENAEFVEEALADTVLSLEDWESLKRTWGKRARDDRAVGKQLRRAMAKARRAHRRDQQDDDT